jgi:hypothetical protein
MRDIFLHLTTRNIIEIEAKFFIFDRERECQSHLNKIQRAREALSQVRLQVNPEEAQRSIKGIYHEGFLKALRKRWRIDENGFATMQSIC